MTQGRAICEGQPRWSKVSGRGGAAALAGSPSVTSDLTNVPQQ